MELTTGKLQDMTHPACEGLVSPSGACGGRVAEQTWFSLNGGQRGAQHSALPCLNFKSGYESQNFVELPNKQHALCTNVTSAACKGVVPLLFASMLTREVRRGF